MQRTRPLSTPAPYLGGKKHLADRIVPMIDAISHQQYIEPFFGMGGIFFKRRAAPKAEVINDINGELVNFFRVLQRHFNELQKVLRFFVGSRDEFNRLKAVPPEFLTDVERAARFYYMQKLCFGGKSSGQSFGVSPGRPRFNIRQLKKDLRLFHERLAGVVIENLDYFDLITRYDTVESLFYLDPPYYDCEGDYGKDVFCKDDFVKMAELLNNIKGAFILSLNDVPEVREIFSAFIIDGVETTYSIAKKSSSKVGEVIITNRQLLQERLF